MKLIIDTNLWISFLIGKRLKQMQYLLSVDTKNCNYKIMRFNDFMIKILPNS